MIAIILADKVGPLLASITEDIHKLLIKVSGREILDYQISAYLNSSLSENDIYIVTGYMSEKIQVFLDKKYPSVNVIHNREYLSKNDMCSFYTAINGIKREYESVVINNAYAIYEESLVKEIILSRYKDTYIPSVLYKFSRNTVKSLLDEIKRKSWNKTQINFTLEQFCLPLINGISQYNIQDKKVVSITGTESLLYADSLFCIFNMSDKKAIICDLDGTVYTGNAPIEPAIQFIKKTMKIYDFYFLTNNTSCPPIKYVEKLSGFGIFVSEKNICTPFTPLIKYLKSKGYKSVFLAATEEVKEFLSLELPGINFSFDFVSNEAIVLTYDKEITYQKLKNIAILLNNKPDMDYVCTHNDIFCPSEHGNIPDIGSMIEMMYMTTGKKPSRIFGKPNQALIENIVNVYQKEKIVIVGDRLYTDKALADKADIDFICVLSGESTRLDVALCENTRNILVLDNLGCLDKKDWNLSSK